MVVGQHPLGKFLNTNIGRCMWPLTIDYMLYSWSDLCWSTSSVKGDEFLSRYV